MLPEDLLVLLVLDVRTGEGEPVDVLRIEAPDTSVWVVVKVSNCSDPPREPDSCELRADWLIEEAFFLLEGFGDELPSSGAGPRGFLSLFDPNV